MSKRRTGGRVGRRRAGRVRDVAAPLAVLPAIDFAAFLKLDPATNGSLLLQVGSPYAAGPVGSLDPQNFNRPSEAVVDAAANEVFVADGYGNQRVIVYYSVFYNFNHDIIENSHHSCIECDSSKFSFAC